MSQENGIWIQERKGMMCILRLAWVLLFYGWRKTEVKFDRLNFLIDIIYNLTPMKSNKKPVASK